MCGSQRLPVAETFAPALLQPEVCCAQDEEGAEGAEKAVKKVRAVAQGAAGAVMYSGTAVLTVMPRCRPQPPSPWAWGPSATQTMSRRAACLK